MARNEAKVFRVSQVETLCRIFHCLPNDLFDWKDEGKQSGDNHLAALQKDKDNNNLKGVLGKLDPKTVEELLKQATGN